MFNTVKNKVFKSRDNNDEYCSYSNAEIDIKQMKMYSTDIADARVLNNSKYNTHIN